MTLGHFMEPIHAYSFNSIIDINMVSFSVEHIKIYMTIQTPTFGGNRAVLRTFQYITAFEN